MLLAERKAELAALTARMKDHKSGVPQCVQCAVARRPSLRCDAYLSMEAAAAAMRQVATARAAVPTATAVLVKSDRWATSKSALGLVARLAP